MVIKNGNGEIINNTYKATIQYDYENKAEKHINLYDSVDKQEGYASFVIENAYRNELETFINVVNGKESAEYTFEEDKQVLAMIDDIEAGNSK